MATRFSEMLDKRNALLHLCSAWEEVIEHLSKFVGSDAAPPKLGISTHGEGLTVPVETIEEIIAEVSHRVDEISLERIKLETTIMEDQNVSTKQGRSKKETATGKEKGTKTKKQANRVISKKTTQGVKG